MKRGDIVKIYQDPITERELDGEARLITPVPYSGKDFEQWLVEFLDDGMRTVRLIKAS